MTHIFLKSGFLIVLVKQVHLILFYDRFFLWQNSRVRSRAIDMVQKNKMVHQVILDHLPKFSQSISLKYTRPKYQKVIPYCILDYIIQKQLLVQS